MYEGDILPEFSYAYTKIKGLGVVLMTQRVFPTMEESLGKQWYFSLTEQQIINTHGDGNSWVQPAHIDGRC